MPEMPQVVRGFGVTFLTMFKKVVTEQYPEQKVPTKPRFHGRHQLNRWADGLEKCVGCELCAWACPADAIFVEGADACYEPGEAPPDDPPFPGRRCGALVTIDPGAEHAAWRRLTDAANSADESGCVEHRDALTRLASRVGRASGKA